MGRYANRPGVGAGCVGGIKIPRRCILDTGDTCGAASAVAYLVHGIRR